jgi:hypothetical protein
MAIKGRSLILDLKNGERQSFKGIGSAEIKKLKFLMGHLPIEDGINPDIEIESLCPSCTNRLSEETRICPKCRLKFKDKNKAVTASILLPAGGFFYSRHRIYGAIMGLIELTILFSIAIAGLNLNNDFSQKKLFQLIFTVIVLISVKAINSFHCNLLAQYPLPEKTNFERRKI